MNTEYYIANKGANKVAGPFYSQFEAEAKLREYPGGEIVPVYNLTEEEVKLRERGPIAHFFWMTISVLLLCGIMGWCGYSCYRTYQKCSTVKNWVATPASLTISNITEEKQYFVATEWTLSGAFEYEVGGQKYTSYDMGVYENGNVKALMYDEINYKVHQNVTCYVNPANPEDAVLFNNAEGGTWTYCLCGLGVLAGIIGLVSLRRKCEERAFLRTLNLL